MKYLISILVFMSCFSMHAQKNNSQAKLKQIFIGFNFSPGYDCRTLKNNGDGSFADEVIKIRNKGETGKSGYSTGLNFCLAITKLFSFKTGIQYSNKGYQTKKHGLVYEQPEPGAPISAKFVYNYHYIDIPMKVNVMVGKGKTRFISSAGFATNFLLNSNQKNVFEYSNGKTEIKRQSMSQEFKKVNISPTISLGAECKLKDKMYVRIEPTFSYGILKNIDTPITEHLWNAGLNFGLYREL